MPATNGTQKANVIFTFNVDDRGNFTYSPDHDWQYFHNDLIRFESQTSGPFKIELERIDVPTVAIGANSYGPFGGPLVGSKGPDGFFAQTGVNDNLSPQARQAAFLSHQGPNTNGFIGKYRYKITATRLSDGKEYTNDAHNGTYVC